MPDPRDASADRDQGSSTEHSGQEGHEVDPMKILDIAFASARLLPPQELKDNYFWQITGSYLPLIASPLGLLGNLSSVISLVDKWRMLKDGAEVADRPWVLGLNATSLALGCMSNILLFLDFNQVGPAFLRDIAMAGYFLATCVYMGMLAGTEYAYFNHSMYYRTQGYWQGVIASILYFVTAVGLGLNVMGKLLKRYDADMNVTPRQRRILILGVLFIMWIGSGAAVFQYLLDIHYGDACYFCLVSCTTLGFGDIVANTNLSRALLIPYVYIGIVLLGMTALFIYQSIVKSSRETAASFAIASRRRTAYDQSVDDPEMTGEMSFNLMRKIVIHQHRKSAVRFVVISVVWLLSFWLLGALIFSYTEHWSYWNAFYFTSIALSAIGYGDYTVKSVGGRSIFIIWCFVSVPTMTAAISELSSVFFVYLDNTLEFLSGRFFHTKVRNPEGQSPAEKYLINSLREDDPSSNKEHMLHALALMLAHNPDSGEYPYQIWDLVVRTLAGSQYSKDKQLPHNFWLSDHSPIRSAVAERKALLLLCLYSMRTYIGVPSSILEDVMGAPSDGDGESNIE